MNHFAVYLFIFSFGAFFVPILSRYLRIPAMVGEIIYGMILGNIIFQQPLNSNLIDFLSQMGFIFIMFLAGLELNFDQVNRRTFRLPVVVMTVIYLAAFFAWELLGRPGGFFLLVAITATSVGVPFIGLKSAGVEKTPFGQTIIWVASLGELLSILLIIIFEVYFKNNGEVSLVFFIEISEMFILIGGAYLMIRLILRFFWRFPRAVYALEVKSDPSEMAVRLAFMVLMSMVALSALFHLELILGAFLGGMMLSFVFRNKHTLENKLSSIGYGFFIPFFFIELGWNFNIERDSIFLIIERALLIFGLILGTRLLGGLFLWPSIKKRSFVDTLRMIVGGSFLLSAPLTLLVAIGKMGQHLSLIDDATYKGLILTAMTGGLIGPLVFTIICPVPENEKTGDET